MRAIARPHLGNYLGAGKGMVELQEMSGYETFYMVADLHTLTTPYDKNTLAGLTKDVVMDYLAIGLDPERSTIFVDSHVPEVIELAYYFSTVTTVAKLSHLPTYKEKIKEYPQHSTMALLDYPVLMAADILAFKAGLVPVGIDQEPHLEVAREIARRMNQDYGTDFPEPKIFATKGKYVPSLLGEGKMSKSVEGSYIALTDNLQTVMSKVAKMPSDAGGPGDIPKEGPVTNIFKYLELFRPDRIEYYAGLYKRGELKYSELKEDLARAIFDELKPIQQRRTEIERRDKDERYVDRIIREGAEKARRVARQTVEEVKEKMGMLM